MDEYNFISDEELENIFLDEEIENAAIKHIQDKFEIDYNDQLIDWDYWAGRNGITSAQAAKLTNFIDPIVWRDENYRLGDIPNNLSTKILKLKEKLDDRSTTWSLTTLANVLGKDAPISMIQAIDNLPQSEAKAVDIGANNNEDEDSFPRSGKYGLRDLDAAEWYKTKKPEDLESMTNPQIEAALIARNKALWKTGFEDWNRSQLVWPKKSPGRKPGK